MLQFTNILSKFSAALGYLTQSRKLQTSVVFSHCLGSVVIFPSPPCLVGSGHGLPFCQCALWGNYISFSQHKSKDYSQPDSCSNILHFFFPQSLGTQLAPYPVLPTLPIYGSSISLILELVKEQDTASPAPLFPLKVLQGLYNLKEI